METSVSISSHGGLSLLKATRVAAAVRHLRTIVLLKAGGRVAGARNVLGVLALCGALGSPLEIEAFGSDGPLAARAVEEILAGSGGWDVVNAGELADV